jgi:transcriptional regulator with XRE-family HTH domain
MVKKPTPLLSVLLARISKATRAFGARAELARKIGVTPQHLSAWLSGNMEPGGEATLQLLKWVTAAEAETKRPASATNTGEPRTRKKRTVYERKQSSPKGKT